MQVNDLVESFVSIKSHVQVPHQKLKIIQVLFLLVMLTFMTSCNAQNNNHSSSAGSAIRKTNIDDHPKLIRTLTSEEYRNVHCSLMDAAGNLWFGTSGEGVYRYDPSAALRTGSKSFTNFTKKDGLNDNTISTILQDKSGMIWFCTDSGICRYDGKNFTRFFDNDKRLNHMVSSGFEDSKGNFWFGTAWGGLYRYDGNTFTSFNYRTIVDIIEDRNGALWFCSWNRGGVASYDGRAFTDFLPPKDGLTDDMIFCAMQDKAGNIWFGTRDNGVCKYDGKRFINFNANEELKDAAVYDIHEDKSGNLWFATESDGVWRYDGKSFTAFTTADGLTHNSVFSILEDRDGFLWFGTRNIGLCRYDGKSFTSFSE